MGQKKKGSVGLPPCLRLSLEQGTCWPYCLYLCTFLLVPELLWTLLSSSSRSSLNGGLWLPRQTKASPRLGAEPQSDRDFLCLLIFSTPAPNKPVPQSPQHRVLWWVGDGVGPSPVCEYTCRSARTQWDPAHPLRESRAPPCRSSGQKFHGGWIYRKPEKSGKSNPAAIISAERRAVSMLEPLRKNARLCLGLKEQF